MPANAPPDVVKGAEAMRSMESQILEASRRGAIEGVVLRYGLFYGPGNPATNMIQLLRRRMLPVVRNDQGTAAVHPPRRCRERHDRGARSRAGRRSYDIVDDHPDSMSEVVAGLALKAGAPRPFSVPPWLPRLLVAVHDGARLDPAAAVERESARRARMGAEISDVARGRGRYPRACGMTDVTAFDEHRPLLFSIAYRMLGSASDAEDVVQDAWLRYRGADDVRSPRAFAATIVTRLCLDRLKSARASREEYVGPWLPEPILTTAAGPGPSAVEGPDVTLQRSESVTLAFLVLLETLSPEERAVFILREVFDYSHDEIAEMLGADAGELPPAVSPGQGQIKNRPVHPEAARSRRDVLGRFADALRSGDARELTALLTEDVGFWSDGGGKVAAARRPLAGRAEVLNFLVGLHRTAVSSGAYAAASIVLEEVNGEPALLLRVGDRLETVFVLSIHDDRIAALRVMRNPDKLRYLERQLQIRTM